MTGAELAALMMDGWLKQALAKHARRYSKQVENQEEYIQDAWLRISEEPGNRTIEWYAEQGGKAVKAAYYRRRYVQKKDGGNLYGNSKKADEKPRNAVYIGRARFINKERERLDSWYYEGEWGYWVRVVFLDGHVKWLPKHNFVFDETQHKSYRDVKKDDSKKWRLNRIAVTKLSQVKTDEDWQEYQHRKGMETHERLRHESGIGAGAHTLPDPERGDADFMERYSEGD